MSPKWRVPDAIRDLKAYKPGRSIEEVAKLFTVLRWIKLASNENPLGISPKAKQAVQKALDQAHVYPHPRSPQLTQKIADHYGCKEQEVIVTSGVDALLAYTMMAFVDVDEEILTSEGSFIGVYVNAKKLQKTLICVDAKDYGFDLSAISKRVNKKTKLVYLANPNNPTGVMISEHELIGFLDQLPDHVLVILDEAYFEYAQHISSYPDGAALLDKYPQLIVTRTMSKAYGMAGLRVGYGLASKDIVAQIMKVKLPFEPTALASQAAVAALDDHLFLEQTQKLHQEGMEFFYSEFDRIHISYVPNSAGNFVMLLFETEQKAQDFTQRCLEKGLILRYLDRFGYPKGVRINTGTKKDNQLAMEIIEKVYQSM